MSLQTSVYQVIRRHALIPPQSIVIVGVSGGADSLALLHVLIGLQAKLNVRLHVATLDHGLRGEAGAGDAAYVESLCAAWGVPCTRGYADVPALMESAKMGVESAARQARYDFLARVAREQGSDIIAVGHHADDQAETVLMHLVRGSGVGGVRGMSFNAGLLDHVGVRLIRPLLGVRRADIEAYCAQQGITYRHDATNDAADTLRNRVRHEVLPLLRSLNPQVERALWQFAEVAALEDAHLDADVLKFTADVHFIPTGCRVPLAAFKRLSPALQRRVMLWALDYVGSEATYSHIVDAVALVQRGNTGNIALFPSGARLRLDYDNLYFDSRHLSEYDALAIVDAEREIKPPTLFELLNNWWFSARFQPSPHDKARLSVPESAALALRTRRRGDRFAPLGLGGRTQKLSEWMIDHKVPQRYRDHIPLITVNGDIAAICWGERWTISEHVAVQADTSHIIYFWLEHTS